MSCTFSVHAESVVPPYDDVVAGPTYVICWDSTFRSEARLTVTVTRL